MKGRSKTPLPWDIAVFLTVTLVGFGYTVQKFSRTLAPLRASEVSRTVASTMVPAESLMTTGASGSRTLDLGCIERRALAERIAVENVQFRMKGRLCEPGGRGTLRVKNLTNNTEATVFFRGDGAQFITDYIPLMIGANRVQVEWKPADEVVARVVLADVVNETR